MHPDLYNYLKQQHCSEQSRFFLHAMAKVFSHRFETRDLRALAREIGEAAAKSLSLTQYDTLTELEAQLNERWRTLGWGIVNFQEQDDCLQICHQGSPLEIACETKDDSWTAGFLEGVYALIFQFLGAGDELHVVQVPSNEADCQYYQLRKNNEV